ncbi:hypothetical protein NIES267_54190 [Calothrix parasitica NIES-267]|uniref:Uncharacterized protein n=1 Tax=Calothrix parasitica NIES-267 TaxID=1973488 RepID=A0A1Z4LXG3_9CYAN|nr:hypothetical protein NIES267_54190 [Calothrix parasitica NIES-267]
MFERYKVGECEAVWQELKNLGEIREQSVKDEALEVAREMMQRVKYNFNIIVNNLIKVGFEFDEPEKVVVPAKPDACEYLDEFEQQWGILPLSVRAWFEVIHSIKLSPFKKLSRNSLQSLDSESVILKYCFHCDYDTNIFDAVFDINDIRWYPREINFYSLEEILAERIKCHDEFKKEWEEGKVDDWTRNYYREKGIDPNITPVHEYLNFLPVGMSASNNESMGFDIGKCTVDCELFNDGEQTDFIDYLRWKLLDSLLVGECLTKNPLHYIYCGFPPEFEKMNAEVKKGIIKF